MAGTSGAAQRGRKQLKEHLESVSGRILPSIRKHSRSLRPAWVERVVEERYPAPRIRGNR